MDIFTYDNIWYNISLWGFTIVSGATVLLAFFIMNDPFGKKWTAVWGLALVTMIAMTGCVFMSHDKSAHQEAYNESVFNHIKDTAEFDRLDGEYDPTAEQASQFVGFYGDDAITCLAGAEPGSTQVEFGCGVEFTPLEEIKKKYAEQKGALDKEDSAKDENDKNTENK